MVRAKECQPWRQVWRHHRDTFSIFLNIKVCCMFSLESPHRGDSNKYTQYTILNIKEKLSQLKNEFETAVVNEPSVLEPLKLHCIAYFFSIKKNIAQNCSKFAAMGFFRWTKERVRNSRGKRATEVLL